MSVDETNKIDFVSLAKNGSCVRLTIADHLDWETEEGEHLLLLQEKAEHLSVFHRERKVIGDIPAS